MKQKTKKARVNIKSADNIYIVPLTGVPAKEIKIQPKDLISKLYFLNISADSNPEITGIKLLTPEEITTIVQKHPEARVVFLNWHFWNDHKDNFQELLNPVSSELNICVRSRSSLLGTSSDIAWITTAELTERFLREGMNEKNFWGRIRFYYQNMGIPFQFYELDYKPEIKTKRNAGLNPKFLLNWYLLKPFYKESFKSINNQEPVVYRGVFTVLSLIILVLLPVMSSKVGISGDEEKHYKHAEYVYNYYASGGKDTTALYQPKTLLHHYGQSFDNLAYIFEKWLKVENPYEFRHFLNSLTGWGSIVFAGLIAALLFGWRAGVIALILMFFSPRWLGHSLNNPVDIPFALGCTMALYYTFRFNREFPYPSWRNAALIAVGLGIAVGIRIGGLMFVAFTLFYTGLNFLAKYGIKGLFSEEDRPKLLRLIIYIVPACLIGYFLGLILWPYALQNPLKNPLQSLAAMTNISNSLRQVFEGKMIWSDFVPWYYSIKYILITIPLIVFTGFIISFFYFGKNIKIARGAQIFALFFTIIFPVFWIIYQKSNVYGGWRHLYFIYPPIVVLAASGFNHLFGIKIKWSNYLVWAILAALLFNPVKHIVINYPHHYIYYNQFIGGTDEANGEYEMDYYYNSLRASADWLIKNKISDLSEDETVIVATNHFLLTRYYFRNHPQVRVIYARYYNRGEHEWDYATMANSYISPFQLKKNIWPPANTIHTIKVDNSPICAVLERKNRYHLQAYQMEKESRPYEAIPYYLKALEADKKYEEAYVSLSKLYLDLGDFENAIRYGNQALKYYKNYENALYYVGLGYMNRQQFDYAIRYLRNAVKSNTKYWLAYYQLGICYIYSNDLKKAEESLIECLTYNGSFKPAYMLMAEIYNRQGDKATAQRYLQAAESLP